MNLAQHVTLPDAKVLEYAEQYNHRLLSLEADLKDLAKSGLLTPKEFVKRIRRLRDAQALQESIKAIVATRRGVKGAEDLQLPVLDHASAAEKKVCIQFFERREGWARALHARLARLHRWLQATMAGRSNFIFNTLRLSKVNRMLRETDHQLALYQQELKSVDYHVERILERMPRSLAANPNGEIDLLKALSQIFVRLDQTVSRVARLKSTVKAEEQRLADMRLWLQKREREMHAATPIEPPPTPLATASAVRDLNETLGLVFEQSEQRLTLAREFWEKVLGQDSVAEDEILTSAVRAVPMKLNKRERKAQRRRDRRRFEAGSCQQEERFAPS